jgi:uncharacterized delta-60 repeat protein
MSRRLRIEPLEDRITPAAGDLDPTFGTGGVAVVPASEYTFQVEVLANNDVATISQSGNNFSVVAYLPSGAPDTGFGTAGHFDFPGVSLAALAPQTDGKLLVVGTTSTGQVVITRLTAAGLPDPGFGTGGTANAPLDADSGTTDEPRSVAIGPGGVIVVAGRVNSGNIYLGAPSSFAATRLLADGTLDASFGSSGFAVVPFPSGPYNTAGANAVAVQADGSVVMAGVAASGNVTPFVNSELAIIRLTSGGVLDTGFGTGGRVKLPRDPASTVVNVLEDVVIRPDGKIMVAGVVSAVNGVNANFGTAARLNTDGSLDTSYGIGGQGYTTSSLEYYARIAPNGSILFAGGPIVRLRSDGFQDSRFGEHYLGNPAGAAFQTDGQIILSGMMDNSGTRSGFLARLNSNGAPPNFFPTAPGVIVASGSPSAGAFQPLTQTNGTYSSHGAIGGFNGLYISARGTTADVTGDSIPDYIVGAGPGGRPQVTVFDGKTGLVVADFFAFEPTFTGGVFVAAADLDGDNKAELVISPDEGGGPRVVVFSVGADGLASQRASFFGFEDPNFRGGARVALGDVNHDTIPDLAVAAGFLGGPRVSLYDGSTILGGNRVRLVNDFFAFPGADAGTLRNGSYVAIGDLNGDGFADLIFGGGPGGAPRIFVLDGQTVAGGDVTAAQADPVSNFFVNGLSNDRGGVRVASVNADGDSKADLVIGSGAGKPANVMVYLGKNIVSAAEPDDPQTISVFGSGVLADGVYVG